MSRPENYLAALSFIRRCWPELHREFPGLWFYIVGSRPHECIKEYHGRDNIVVTGFVEDPYGYLNGALMTVAPITLGAGIKVKVLESLMVGTPVVAFPAGAEGINLKREEGLTVVRNHGEMIREIHNIVAQGMPVSREQIRAAAERAFNWAITEEFLREEYR
jgi:glycosyltransferase involved in cell wall biosynthesis